MLDLVIKGGTVVTAGSLGVCDIGVQGGQIVQIGGEMHGRRELDARQKYVFPGGVDVHVHLSPPSAPTPGVEQWVDDFYSGSLAAIAGGVTTIGNMTFQWAGETPRDALARDMAAAGQNAAVDYILHPVLNIPTPPALAQIPELAAEGHTSFKIFLVTPTFDAHVADYLRAMQLAASNGVLTMLHCEDGALIGCLCRELLSQGRRALSYYPDSRPDYTELVATERAIGMARATGAPIYVVHLSSAVALASSRRARANGVPVYVETRPLYLYLTRELLAQPDGAKYTGAPPLREPEDQRLLWLGLNNGDIQCLCTDHAPWSLHQKLDPALDITAVRAGVAELETLMPMLFSEGVRKGRISLSRFVELTSTNAARLFGMYPQKGTIAVGSDADLVIWDAEVRRTIDGAAMQSNAGYSPYDGREVQGWPTHTISRGEVVLEEGVVTARRGRGRWVRRGPTMRL
ncbi:MAG: dihydropyrimidinase [Ardenticatenaceae bacterium]|nr:dihydropyrimidinase [Ardenticatenaceae bacterium]